MELLLNSWSEVSKSDLAHNVPIIQDVITNASALLLATLLLRAWKQ